MVGLHGVQESQRKVALLEAMVLALRDKLREEEARNTTLAGARSGPSTPWLRLAHSAAARCLPHLAVLALAATCPPARMQPGTQQHEWRRLNKRVASKPLCGGCDGGGGGGGCGAGDLAASKAQITAVEGQRLELVEVVGRLQEELASTQLRLQQADTKAEQLSEQVGRCLGRCGCCVLREQRDMRLCGCRMGLQGEGVNFLV
jgi:hypothetical protein